MIKNLIFDLDGTLIDDYKEMLSIFMNIVYKYSNNENQKKYIRDYKNKGTQWLLHSLDIEGEGQILMMKELLSKLGENISQTKLHPEIRETLKFLKVKGVNLGLLTSNNEKNINNFLKLHKIELFNFVYPNAGLFSKAELLSGIVEKENLNVGETAYVGDEDRDISAAKKANMMSVAVTWGFNSEYLLKLSKPDHLVKKPSELLEIAGSV